VSPQENLKIAINNIVGINEMAWNDFRTGLKEKKIKKGSFLWREGQTCRHLAFLHSGLIRSLSYNDGKEITHTFYESNNLFYDDYSFLSQNPCQKAYQVLADSELILVSRVHLHTMFDRHKCFERLGRLAVEQAHVSMIQDVERLNQSSSEENYKDLLITRPNLLQQVSQKVIASYLNISPEHLSRIRLKISKRES